MRTLSQFIRECSPGRIDLLKIGVEKSEIDVLKGIEQEHWPLISQVVAGVHDLDGHVAEATGSWRQLVSGSGGWTRECAGQSGMPMLYARRPAAAPGPKPRALLPAWEAGPTAVA